MSKGIIALSPLLVFIGLYLVTSIIAGDFYKVPITVAFMISSVYAIIISGGIPLRQRIDIFNRGAGTENMMLMLWIFVLAGAFANSAKVMGCIDATVNLALTLLPGMMTAVVVGGSFFGDNLSFISDTTIVSTSTQGCKLSDKFRVNSFLAMPAAALILLLYVAMGHNMNSPQNLPEVEYIKVMPYIVVLIVAVLGMNVMAVLTIGIALTGIIGIPNCAFDIYGWFGAMGDGILGMGELIIITMMAGGMLELIKANGGIDYIITTMTRHVKGKRGAELSIAALVALVDICTANNTVAIITVGGIAKQIADRFGVDNRKSASILDTMSCCMQGIIPYGAQILMAAGLASINPVSIIPYLYYPFCIGVIAILAIVFRYPKRYS